MHYVIITVLEWFCHRHNIQDIVEPTASKRYLSPFAYSVTILRLHTRSVCTHFVHHQDPLPYAMLQQPNVSQINIEHRRYRCKKKMQHRILQR